MAKIGRNDPCPCGSSKKYKQCCLAKDEAAARAAAPPPPEPSPRRAGRVVFPQDDDDVDLLTEASNAVIALIRAGDIDAAEQGFYAQTVEIVHYPVGSICYRRFVVASRASRSMGWRGPWNAYRPRKRMLCQATGEIFCSRVIAALLPAAQCRSSTAESRMEL